MNTTAAQGGTLYVAEFNSSPGTTTPTVAQLIRKTEVVIPATDQSGTIDQVAWGLTTGTEKAPKAPIRVAVTPGAYLLIGLQASDGGAFYARIQKIKNNEGGVDITSDDNDMAALTTAPVAKTLTKVSKFVTTASTAEALVASQTFARKLNLHAKKAAADNTGNVFIGLSTLDSGVDEMFELAPGGTFEYEAPAGTKIDLNTIYIDSITNADGVVGWYMPV